MSVYVHSNRCFTTASVCLQVSEGKVQKKLFYQTFAVNIQSSSLENVPVEKKKEENNSQNLLHKW